MVSDYHFRKKPESESVPAPTSELRMTTAKNGRKQIAKSLSVKSFFDFRSLSSVQRELLLPGYMQVCRQEFWTRDFFVCMFH